MLINITAVRSGVSTRDAVCTLKGVALKGNDHLSLSLAGQLVNMIRTGQPVYINANYPTLLLKYFVVSKDSMSRMQRAIKTNTPNPYRGA